MPGFNQRGPMNQGPMTGRGQGDCEEKLDKDLPNSRPDYRGDGKGRGMRRRGRQGLNRGMDYCQKGKD